MILSDSEIDLYKNFCLSFLDEIDNIISSESNTFTTDTKIDNSVVTSIDLNIETKFRDLIKQKFTDHSVVGEEFSESNSSKGFHWIIDPIDGTYNFIKGVPFYANLISLYFEDKPILGLINYPALKRYVYCDFRKEIIFNGTVFKKNNNFDKNMPLIGLSNPKYINNLSVKDDYINIIKKYQNILMGSSALNQHLCILGNIDLIYDFGYLWDVAAIKAILSFFDEYQELGYQDDRYYFIAGRKSLFTDFKKDLSSFK